QPLDFLGAAIEGSTGAAVAGFPRLAGVGQHRVFSRQPAALVAFVHPMWDLILNADGAQHFGVATFGEHGTWEVREGTGELDWPVLVRRSVVLASQGSTPRWGQPETLSHSQDRGEGAAQFVHAEWFLQAMHVGPGRWGLSRAWRHQADLQVRGVLTDRAGQRRMFVELVGVIDNQQLEAVGRGLQERVR